VALAAVALAVAVLEAVGLRAMNDRKLTPTALSC
jgi:hypothetical protein